MHLSKELCDTLHAVYSTREPGAFRRWIDIDIYYEDLLKPMLFALVDSNIGKRTPFIVRDTPLYAGMAQLATQCPWAEFIVFDQAAGLLYIHNQMRDEELLAIEKIMGQGHVAIE